MANPKTAKKAATSKRKRKKRVNFRQVFMVSLMLLAAVAFIFSSLPSGLFRPGNSGSVSSGSSTTKSSGPSFKKEGELTFMKKDGTPNRKVNIEIAPNEAERNLGLMYRYSLPDDSGMLFIMDKNEPQAFWMKNTFISLDIIYINEQKEIVSIAEMTTPRSEVSIPSKGNAKYVLEMIGGYCKTNNIEAGDRLEWE